MRANLFIGSNEITTKEYGTIHSPFSNEPVSHYAKCDAEDAKEALKVAQQAFDESTSTLSQRINWLKDVAQKLKENIDDIAKTITDEVGKPIAFSKLEVNRCIETIELSCAEVINLHGETIPTDATQSGFKTLSFTKRVPLGVIVAITPFNFPLNLIAHKLAPALVLGNAVVLKPTPEAPLTAYKFAKLFIESAFAVPNLLSVVYGDAEVGSALVSSHIPRKISFTGSVQVGEIITRHAGIKKISLELGGNAATFIDQSANIAHSAKRCAFGAFLNSGQVCISLQRIYVHEAIYDEFAQALKEESEKLKVGNPYAEDTFLSALINEESVQRALNWTQSAIDEGAKLLLGNKAEGNTFYPTVLMDVTDEMKIVCEEVFAPIVSLVKVQSYDEAIAKINNSPYGLQFSIFTNDLSNTYRFIEEVKSGGVVINDIPTLRFDIQPYGGVKLSGIGKEGPKYTLEEMSEIKSVVMLKA